MQTNKVKIHKNRLIKIGNKIKQTVKDIDNPIIESTSGENKKNTSQEITSIERYLNSLNEKERQALEIAKNHLETSFDIEKCIGYQKFVQSQTNK